MTKQHTKTQREKFATNIRGIVSAGEKQNIHAAIATAANEYRPTVAEYAEIGQMIYPAPAEGRDPFATRRSETLRIVHAAPHWEQMDQELASAVESQDAKSLNLTQIRLKIARTYWGEGKEPAKDATFPGANVIGEIVAKAKAAKDASGTKDLAKAAVDLVKRIEKSGAYTDESVKVLRRAAEDLVAKPVQAPQEAAQAPNEPETNAGTQAALSAILNLPASAQAGLVNALVAATKAQQQ